MTRSRFEQAFIEKHHLPYEQLSLPYVRNYVPDFHTDKYILELKGVLDREDAQKISSVYSFLSSDKVYIITGGKFKHIESLTEMTDQFNPIIFKYPDLEYAIAPQMTPAQLASYRLSRGRGMYHERFPLTGSSIVAWANKMRIPALPMSYEDHREWEKYHANFL
jgi:hypothetical protein